MAIKKTQVLDTSVLLTDSNSIHSFGNSDIVLPLKVLEEIDGHKKRQDSVGSNARQFIRTLDTLRKKANLEKKFVLHFVKLKFPLLIFHIIGLLHFPFLVQS